MTFAEIQRVLQTADSFAAVELIQHEGSAADIAATFESTLLDLYWKAHDLPAMIAIGRAGIFYCLRQSLRELSPDSVTKLRQSAKGMAYNIGSFTWPGWDEPGITPTPDDLAIGRDCARLNLRLAIELKKPPIGVSKAHWLIGAHALAIADFATAEDQFRQSIDVLPATDDQSKDLTICNRGYLALAQSARSPVDAEARKQFQEILTILRARSDEDAKSYLTQLESTRRHFTPHL